VLLTHYNKTIFSSILSLSAGKLFQLMSKFILSITIARVLGPSQFGFWSMIELINKYSPLLTLGVSSGVKRELPYWKGKNDTVNQYLTEMSGYVSLLFSLILFSIFGILSFYIIDDGFAKYAIMATFIAGGIAQLYMYIYSIYLAKKKFNTAAKIISIEGGLILLITITLVYKYGFYGLLFGNIFVPLSICIFILYKYEILKNLKFDCKIFRRILSIGIPLLLVGLGYVFLLTVNRLIIPIYLSVEHVGYFSFAMLFLTLFSPLIGSIGEILYTYMNEHVGHHERVDNMDYISIYPGLFMALIIPCIIIPIMLLIPWGINAFFPNYVESIPSAQLVLILVTVTAGGGVNILSSFMKQNLMIVFLFISIIINIYLCTFFLKNGYKLEWTVFALIIGSVFYKISNTIASLLIMEKSYKTYFLVAATFIYSIGISFITYYNFDIAIKYAFITISIPYAVFFCTIFMIFIKRKVLFDFKN
jgi:O-antigen/teichoic acid export membrane protein